MNPFSIAPLPPTCRAADGAGQLSGDTGSLSISRLATMRSAEADALNGQPVSVTGHLAPSLVRQTATFVLTEGTGLPCRLCGNVHGRGAEIIVTFAETADVSAVALHDMLEVRGRVAAGDGIRLDDCTFRIVDPTAGMAEANRAWREAAAKKYSDPANRRVAKIHQPRPPVRRPNLDGIADIIVKNGRFHTVNGLLETVEAVAIRGGRFLAAGDEEAVNAHAGPDTEIIDIGGRAAIPGLIDSHIHQIFHAFNVPCVDLLGARSVADVQKLIGERAGSTPKGEWVVASSGWHESLLAEGRMPTRWELDEVSPDHPVIIPRGGHVVTLNSKGLERAGITDDTPDPKGGVIVRDKDSGEATGILLETAAYFGRRVAPLMPKPEDMDRLLADAMAELNSYGIVCVVDPVIDETTLAVYKRVRDAGAMTVRTDLLFKASTKEETERAIAIMKDQESDDMLRFPGIKFMADGGVEGARLKDPYQIVPGEQPDPDYRGLLMMPPGGEDEFVALLELIAEAGLQVQTHGVGDEAIDVIVRAYERCNQNVPIDGLNWCLMHAFLPTEEAIQTMRDIGVLVTVQDHPVLLGHNQKRWWGDERAAKAIPIRSLVDSGLLVGGGTDGPVVPVDPFLSMWWMVTRQTLLDYALGPEEGISAEEALQLYTINNARILGVEEDRGSIEPGKLADMAVLSQDILAVEPDEIRNTRALLTMVGGKIVYQDGL